MPQTKTHKKPDYYADLREAQDKLEEVLGLVSRITGHYQLYQAEHLLKAAHQELIEATK